MNKIRRLIIYILFTTTFFVLQGTLFKAISFGNIAPNLMLILCVSFGLMQGRKTGLLIGFFSGILMDIFVADYIGFYALLLMYLGYMAGCFNKVFYAEDIKLPMGMIIFTDLIYGICCYGFMYLLRGRLNFVFYFLHICIPECVYTILMTIIIYPLILVIDQTLVRAERKQAKKFV
ncbi:MAG: rod shape-determining protein MreD [Lachnospiraceae bacterium]|nr:rod shape-determining protein MreD [Lachnospiraceae bacterium]